MYAYVADMNSVRVINVANPLSPTEVGYIDTPNGAWGLTAHDNCVIVAGCWSV